MSEDFGMIAFQKMSEFFNKTNYAMLAILLYTFYLGCAITYFLIGTGLR